MSRAARLGLATARATRTRYKVVAFAVTLAMVTYLDRVCIGVLAPAIMDDLGLTRIQMSFVFSAFTAAYAIFEIPTAWWADKAGTRRVLARIVAWWSTFTMLTGAVSSYAAMLVVRFLFGMGEAGAWPSVARTFSSWIPARERGTVQGIFFAGAHLAGGVTPILVMWMSGFLPWRAVFLTFGLGGFVWVAAWWRWFRDDPADHQGVGPEELRLIVTGRRDEKPHAAGWQYWRKLFGNPNLLPLCLMYFANSYGFYFYITWLPAYLRERGFSAGLAGALAGLPLTLSVLGDLFGGVTTDRVAARFGLRAGRAIVGAAAYLVAGAAMIAAGASPNPLLSAVLIAVAAASCMFTLGAAWSFCIDIGGRHAGVVSAAMNTSGQVGGVLSPIILAYVVQEFKLWSAPLYLMGALFLVGAVSWWRLDPEKRVFE